MSGRLCLRDVARFLGGSRLVGLGGSVSLCLRLCQKLESWLERLVHCHNFVGLSCFLPLPHMSFQRKGGLRYALPSSDTAREKNNVLCMLFDLIDLCYPRHYEPVAIRSVFL